MDVWLPEVLRVVLCTIDGEAVKPKWRKRAMFRWNHQRHSIPNSLSFVKHEMHLLCIYMGVGWLKIFKDFIYLKGGRAEDWEEGRKIYCLLVLSPHVYRSHGRATLKSRNSIEVFLVGARARVLGPSSAVFQDVGRWIWSVAVRTGTGTQMRYCLHW